MNKVTLTFPDYESLWLFKEKIKTVNISIEPKKKNIHGPFHAREIEIALVEFKAINNTPDALVVNSVPIKITSAAITRFSFLSFLFNFFQLMKI